jgi:hypothetical protein
MVKNVDEKAAVEGTIRKRKPLSVKKPAGDGTVGPRMDLDPLNLQGGDGIPDERSQCAIPATHVQESATGTEESGKALSQYRDPSFEDQGVMKVAEDSHGALTSPAAARSLRCRCHG